MNAMKNSTYPIYINRNFQRDSDVTLKKMKGWLGSQKEYEANTSTEWFTWYIGINILYRNETFYPPESVLGWGLGSRFV